MASGDGRRMVQPGGGLAVVAAAGILVVKEVIQ